MHRPKFIHPSIELDSTVERKSESELHWAIKAALVHQFRSNPECQGEIQAEKKTEELIADIQCRFEGTPADIPRKCVVEVQTSKSDKDVLRTTTLHLRFGWAVYWVFDIAALDDQREAEETLDDWMSPSPSLGIASLEDGELSLGSPITWDGFEFPRNDYRSQLYIPTYDRQEQWFDHGEFSIDGEQMAVYGIDSEPDLYLSKSLDNGQLTLPQRSPWSREVLFDRIDNGEIQRKAPVRGPP